MVHFFNTDTFPPESSLKSILQTRPSACIRVILFKVRNPNVRKCTRHSVICSTRGEKSFTHEGCHVQLSAAQARRTWASCSQLILLVLYLRVRSRGGTRCSCIYSFRFLVAHEIPRLASCCVGLGKRRVDYN